MYKNRLETLTLPRWRWIVASWPGAKGMNYPRWDGIRFVAGVQLDRWHCLRDWHNGNIPRGRYRAQAFCVLAAQPFTGLRPEWVDEHYPWA